MKKNMFALLGMAVVLGAQAQNADPDLPALVKELGERSVASICDAVDKVTGKRGFMQYDMRPLSREKACFVGPAVTTLIEPSLEADTPASLALSLEAIDEGAPGSVLVVQVEADLTMTGIGGLMATTCKARDFAGAVIDGAARDVDEIDKLAFPVFARAISPASVVGRMVSTAKNTPVKCGGVLVRPGDLIVAGSDGVVVVPMDKAAEVLRIATEIDEKETRMVPLIIELKSIKKAVDKYKRM